MVISMMDFVARAYWAAVQSSYINIFERYGVDGLLAGEDSLVEGSDYRVYWPGDTGSPDRDESGGTSSESPFGNRAGSPTVNYAGGAATRSLNPGQRVARAAGRVITQHAPNALSPQLKNAIRTVSSIARQSESAIDMARTAARGTRQHKRFADLFVQSGLPNFKTEMSFKKNGARADYSEAGSIRLDVVYEDPATGKPLAIFDLKTGSAVLSAQRIAQLRKQLPRELRHLPIIGVLVR